MHKIKSLTILFILISSLSSSLVSADQVIERKNYPKGHVTVDGIKIDGNEREITMPDGSAAVVLEYRVRAYPGDALQFVNEEGLNGKYRFFRGIKQKGYVENKITFVAISDKGLKYDLKSGLKASVKNKQGKPLRINFKKTWKEFDGQEGIYVVNADHMRNLPRAQSYFDDQIGWWAIDSALPKEENGKLVPSGERYTVTNELYSIWGNNGYAPQDPTRDVLTEYSRANPPKDGSYENYHYFKRTGDGTASKSVELLENGQRLAADKAETIKTKKDIEIVNAKVEIDSFDPDYDSKEKMIQDYLSAGKKNKPEKEEKEKNWWDKLLSWLVYDEDFVTQQVEEMKGLLSAGIGDGFSVSEERDERTVLYDYALENGQWTRGYGTIAVYGGTEVLNNLGTGYTTIGDWYTISKGFTKWLFILASNAYIIKKLYKRFDGNG